MADNSPGTPIAEHVNDIATRLKEIEAERAKERQAGILPEIDITTPERLVIW
jgi:hypothetical protein